MLKKQQENAQRHPAHEGDTQQLQQEMILMMLRTIGEEFNRPLGLIANNCEYLQQHLTRAGEGYSLEKAQGALTDISNATLHLNRLFDNFVEMNASLHGVLKPAMELVDLVSVLRCVCADSEEIYRAIGIHLRCDVGELTQALVVADRTYVERICLNLLSNALHACTEGEHVTFALCETEGGFALTVTDDGYGFPAENILVAFSPAQNRAMTPAGGFERGGKMGLYLCGEYCRLMGWEIGIALKEPGTQITVAIPRNDEIHLHSVCFHSSEYETQVQAQMTRVQVLRELRSVPGLEGLRMERV